MPSLGRRGKCAHHTWLFLTGPAEPSKASSRVTLEKGLAHMLRESGPQNSQLHTITQNTSRCTFAYGSARETCDIGAPPIRSRTRKKNTHNNSRCTSAFGSTGGYLRHRDLSPIRDARGRGTHKNTPVTASQTNVARRFTACHEQGEQQN